MNISLASTPVRRDTAATAVEEAQQWQIREFEDTIVISESGIDSSDVLPDDWQARLLAYFDLIPSLAAIGPKRTGPDDKKVWSMGEFIIHPKGFHHLGRGETAVCYRFPEEVDCLSGGVIAVSRPVYEAVGGIDQEMGCLGAVDLCLRLRLEGGRCLAVPDAILSVNENELCPDENVQAAFFDKWGFDWASPDLDDVRSRYAGTGLLWNVRFHGTAMPFEKYVERPALHWHNYVNVEPYRQRADLLVNSVANLTPTGLCVDLGCGDGLYSHLLALKGVEMVGIDPEEAAIEQALTHVNACKTYPGPRPRFTVTTGCHLPLDDASARTVFMLDVIEHLPNPIRVLKEVARVLEPGGHLFASTPAARYAISSDPVYHITEYSPAELKHQIRAVPGLKVTSIAGIGGLYRDILITACKD